ncbi:hypothetical protein G3I42_24635, partial [Streptomyces sp. SID11385]|nr:hypothetical protein [Streptomyces sp. SID11385]
APAERPAPAKPAASGPGVAPAPTVEPSSETTMLLHLPPAPDGESGTGTGRTPPPGTGPTPPARDGAPAPVPEQHPVRDAQPPTP